MPPDNIQAQPESERNGRKPRSWRLLRLGCAGLLLFACGAPAALVAAASAGPLQLPGGGELRAGSADFVLSNFSFQNGTSYFLDLHGTGARTILEANYIESARTIELVLLHSTREDRAEHRLLSWQVP
jgi:hypothetical protein